MTGAAVDAERGARGSPLQRVRERRGLTRRLVAETLAVHESKIESWEEVEAWPADEQRRELSGLLRVSEDILFPSPSGYAETMLAEARLQDVLNQMLDAWGPDMSLSLQPFLRADSLSRWMRRAGTDLDELTQWLGVRKSDMQAYASYSSPVPEWLVRRLSELTELRLDELVIRRNVAPNGRVIY